MPLDARARRFLDVLAASQPADVLSLTVAERRYALAQLMQFGGPRADVGPITETCIQGPAGPLRMRRYDPPAAGAGLMPGIAFFHGGGFVAGSLDTHDGIARALTAASGLRLVSVDYRLAPENPFPAALDDAVVAVRHLLHHPADFGLDGRLAVCGDSAGATLAAATCQALYGAAGVAPRVQVLICPILDYAAQTASRREFGSGFLLYESTLRHDLAHYLPAHIDPSDPRVSPLRSVNLPVDMSSIIHTAEFDPLRDEGEHYARRLTEGGLPVAYTCHPGMIHLFYGLGAVIPYARTAILQLGAELASILREPFRGEAVARPG